MLKENKGQKMKFMKKRHKEILLGVVIASLLGFTAFAQEETSTEPENKTESPKLISVNFRDAEIQDVMRSIADLSGVNIVMGKDVKGTVTVSLKDIDLDGALDAILSVNGFQYRWKRNVILVEKGEELLDSAVFTIDYANAAEVKEMLEKVTSEKGVVKINEKLNEIIVTDFARNIDKAKQIIEQIDKPPLQVKIESKLVEVEIGALKELGVRWKMQYSNYKGDSWRRTKDADGKEVVNYKDKDGQDSTIPLNENWDTESQDPFENGKVGFDVGSTAGVDPSSVLSGGTLLIEELATIGQKYRIGAAIDALVQDKKATILSSPSITTLNNKQASIVVGEKVGIRETTQTTTGTTESIRFEDAGVKLYVTPKIAKNDYITMLVKPEVSSITDYTDTQLRITTTQAETNVRVKDQHTVVIGGLIKDEETRISRKVPILGSIPILGIPFRNTNNDRTKKELIIFLTPTVLKDGRFETKSTMSEAADYDEKRDQEAQVAEEDLLKKFSDKKLKGNVKDYRSSVMEEKEKALSLFKEAKRMETLAYRTRDERKHGLYNKAIAYYLSVARDYKDLTKYSAEALYDAGYIYYKYLKDYSAAKAVFEEVLKDYPETSYAKKSLKYIKKIDRMKKKEE
jgi:type IV pilus secretin PilQ/predicted competence protein